MVPSNLSGSTEIRQKGLMKQCFSQYVNKESKENIYHIQVDHMWHVSIQVFFSWGVFILWGNKLTSCKPAPNLPEKFVLIFTESAMAKRASMCFPLGILREDLSSKWIVHFLGMWLAERSQWHLRERHCGRARQVWWWQWCQKCSDQPLHISFLAETVRPPWEINLITALTITTAMIWNHGSSASQLDAIRIYQYS